MRSKLDEQLEYLHSELIEMGRLCEVTISDATKALLDGDMVLAEKVINSDDAIDQKEHEIESLCLKLFLLQQPVARDLRKISSALKMITDLERIGDQATDIAQIVKLENITASNKDLHIKEMANATIKMVNESIDAFVKSDLELAHSVIEYDDVVDNLFNKVKNELIDIISVDKSCGEFAIDLIIIAKYFERIGDHATNIAEWVEFSITGEHRNGLESGIN